METALQRARRVMKQKREEQVVFLPLSVNDINDRNDQTTPAQARPTIDGMTLAEFAVSGRTVRIHSTVLGCEVLLAADNAADADIERAGCPVYRAQELSHLRQITPEGLRLVHEVKVAFTGQIVDHSEPESRN